MNDFFIALGANLSSTEGPPEVTLRAALEMLENADLKVQSVSAFYRTPCFPAGAGPDYVNAAAHLQSALSPEDLLARLHKIEAFFGRERHNRWGMRTLDLDLIASGDRVLPDRATYIAWRDLPLEAQRQAAPDQLILPHPRLQDRAFVLVPLRDIAAQWRHPVLDRTVAEMCDALSPDLLAEIVVLDA
ncbi:2-amino-4-hydroxy-6-hydroxymethyldihydropteridine diphosphokinase [Marivita sp. S2033]|uniref:2-amino-4-hydroxy-6- hydroxymethyldihydropteridine diphosphokinase n=1 Tax=Marivita sp. S2033 TaxID=3373187 RepID=UPI003981F492